MSAQDAIDRDSRKLCLLNKKMKDDDDDDSFLLSKLNPSCEYLYPKGTRKPSSSSPLTSLNEISMQRGFLDGIDPTVVFDEGPCPACLGEHPRCDVCYKFHHHQSCAYFTLLPQGAHFNPRYTIVCACGSLFNEDKWICTSCCEARAVLVPKRCDICLARSHCSYECPVDKDLAAFYKSSREERLSHVPERVPYESLFDAQLVAQLKDEIRRWDEHANAAERNTYCV